MTVLLCIDVLGTEVRWQRGGSSAAAALWEDFGDLVLDTAASLDVADEIRGEIDSDTCVLQCPTTESALALGRRVFRRSWLETRSPGDLRLWLRGLVCGGALANGWRHGRPDDELTAVRRSVPSEPVQKAFTALRSGFHGMRILVDERLLSDQLRGMFRIPLGRLGVIPFRRMNFTPYPPSLSRTWQDFLWMAENAPEWSLYTMRMKQRMLWSAGDHAEFVQCAATQVVFHECDAILQSVTRKNQTRREDRSEHEDEADAGAAQ